MRKFAGVLLLCATVLTALSADAAPSSPWRKVIGARTVRLWVDAQFMDELVLNARARVDVTWLPRSLMRLLDRDGSAEDWVVAALSNYYASRKEAAERMRGHDVLALRYRAEKNWNFDPTALTVDGYRVTSEDLLGNASIRVVGELPSGTEGTLLVRVPSLKGGRRVRLALDPDSADLETPAR